MHTEYLITPISADNILLYFFATVGLLSIIANLVKLVKKNFKNPSDLQQVFSDNNKNVYSSPKAAEKELGAGLNPKDKKFMNDISRWVLSDISNPHLNVETLTKKMGYSRTGLFTRLKHISGMGPNEFISEMRLNMAAQMILQGEHSLQEISDETGFSTYSYFSKAFKKRYGVSPREYKA